jgi:hypothetical protein
MRERGVRGILAYCADYHWQPLLAIIADQCPGSQHHDELAAIAHLICSLPLKI